MPDSTPHSYSNYFQTVPLLSNGHQSASTSMPARTTLIYLLVMVMASYGHVLSMPFSHSVEWMFTYSVRTPYFSLTNSFHLFSITTGLCRYSLHSMQVKPKTLKHKHLKLRVFGHIGRQRAGGAELCGCGLERNGVVVSVLCLHLRFTMLFRGTDHGTIHVIL